MIIRVSLGYKKRDVISSTFYFVKSEPARAMLLLLNIVNKQNLLIRYVVLGLKLYQWKHLGEEYQIVKHHMWVNNKQIYSCFDRPLMY